MSVTLFNIGLSLLSRNTSNKIDARHKTALQILSLLEGRDVTDNDISREESGRPFFKGQGKEEQNIITDFNISHSDNMVAVSHVRGAVAQDSILRTGCDIQIIKERPNTLRIAEQFFYPAERSYITTQKEQGNNSAFFEIWTLKECYIKLRGLSVFDMVPKGDNTSIPNFSDKNGRLNLNIDGISFFLFKLTDKENKYILAAAVNDVPKDPSMQWFSEHSLNCECII